MKVKNDKRYWEQCLDESVSEIAYYQRRRAPLFVNKYYEHQLKRAFATIVHNLKLEENVLILEIGSGTGRWAQQLIGMNINCIYSGIDFNQKAVSLAHSKRLSNCHFLTMDGMKLAYKSNCFDCAISITAIQHIPNEGWRDAVKEMVRVVKPNGRIAIIENNRYPWINEFTRNHCELLVKKGQRYSFARELLEHMFPLPKELDRFLTTLSYPLEPIFEKIVPIRLAKHVLLIFKKEGY